jgi:hypothetical protein
MVDLRIWWLSVYGQHLGGAAAALRLDTSSKPGAPATQNSDRPAALDAPSSKPSGRWDRLTRDAEGTHTFVNARRPRPTLRPGGHGSDRASPPAPHPASRPSVSSSPRCNMAVPTSLYFREFAHPPGRCSHGTAVIRQQLQRLQPRSRKVPMWPFFCGMDVLGMTMQ